MEAQSYTAKSIAVFGETKPWIQNLKELGGRFNKNLNGQPGWIFPKSKEGAVIQFINDANSGRIIPLPIQPRSPSLSVAYAPSFVLPSRSPVLPPRPPMLPPRSNEIMAISFPNLFVGADGLNYQIIMYTVPLPAVNQLVDIRVGQDVVEYQVIEIEKKQAPFDSILIAPIKNRNQVSRAVIINGTWKVEGMEQEHEMIFK